MPVPVSVLVVYLLYGYDGCDYGEKDRGRWARQGAEICG